MGHESHHFGTYYSYLALAIFSFLLIKLAQFIRGRRRSHLRVLNGPPSTNFLFGNLSQLMPSAEHPKLLDRWVKEYGQIFKVPVHLGGTAIIISDPKAIAHVFANDSFTYVRIPAVKALNRAVMGHNMLSADKEDHRRQRRAMAPAFTNATMRGTTGDFYEAAYKVKSIWDSQFESRDEATIDVQHWINKITLDSIGIAGFGHDFKSIEGHQSPVEEVFEAFLKNDNNSLSLVFLLGMFTPHVLKLPLKGARLMLRMKSVFSEIAEELIENSRKEKEVSDNVKDRSIIGLLLKGRSTDANFKLTQEELVGQIAIFLFAGYDTTAISLSWALIELARHPEKQEKLRQELRDFGNTDPTWDELTSGKGLEYLDAVVHEILRLHPPAEQLRRVADKDDAVPLSTPIKLADGREVDSIVVPKGTMMFLPFVYVNRSEAFWGEDAKQFVPERWLQENTHPSKEFLGHRHLYTFSDGPRICIGRMFALAEFKAVLSVFIRNFTFELPNGPSTEIAVHPNALPRPKVAAESGCALPMRVRQVVN